MNDTLIEHQGRQFSLGRALALGREHLNAGRLDEATMIYQQILAKLPEHAEAWHLLGVIALQQGRYADAVADIERALCADKGLDHALSNLGVAYKSQGNLDRAETVLREALAVDPYCRDARFNLGTVLQAAGKFPQAASAYRKVLELEPDSVDALSALGSVLPALGEAEDAVDVCRRALMADPTFAIAHLHLGKALRALGQNDAAAETFRDCVSLQPDLAQAWLGLADVLRAAGDLPKALEAYRRGIALRPDLAASGDGKSQGRQVGSVYKFHLIDDEWNLPPFDPQRSWLLPIDPLIETARDRKPRKIQLVEICHPDSVASLARYESCDIRYPGIVLVNVANPCGRRYRLIDGNHRLQKLRAMGKTEGSFHVFTLDEVRHLIREYSHYIREDG